MSTLKKVLLTLFLGSTFVIAQNNQLDSLNKVLNDNEVHLIDDIHRIVNQNACLHPDASLKLLEKAQALSNKFTQRGKYANGVYLKAHINYCQNKRDRSLIDTLNKCIRLAEPLSNYEVLCKAYLLLGKVYQNLYNFNSSTTCLKKAVHYGEFMNNKVLLGKAYHELGKLYLHRTNHDKALKYLYQSANVLNDQHDDVATAMTYNSLGQCMDQLDKNEEALQFYLKAINILEKSKNNLGAVYNNLGKLYSKRYDFEASTKCYRKGLELHQEFENFTGMAFSFNYLGNDLFTQGKYDKAMSYYNEALRYNIDKNKEIWAEVYKNLGKVNIRTNNFSKGISYYKKALKHAKSIETRTIELELYELLYLAYEKSGKVSTSLQYLKLFTTLKDSVLNIETSFKISELQAAYDSEQKENEIELLTKEKEIESTKNRKQRQIIIYAAILMFIFIVLSYLLFQQGKQNRRKKKIIEEQNTKIVNSINYAKKIQDAILAPIETIRAYLPDTFVFYKPKDIVSGDFYWFSHIDGVDIIVAADCTGHGVPGAFMSMIGTTLLNKIVNERKITDPKEILNQLNQEVLIALKQKEQNSKSKEGMDITLCAINKKTKTIQYSGAMNSLYVVKNGQVQVYKPNLRSIGGMTKKLNNAEFTFEQETFQYEEGTSIYMISDGYVDQFGGPNKKKYNTKKFKELLSRIHFSNIHQQRNDVEQEFDSWKGDYAQTDDVLIIGIKL